MAFSLRKLEIFTAVAEKGSVSKAAKTLYLSQSAVSMAIADLESHRSEYLFIRQGRRLHLNDRGRMLLPLATKILKDSINFEKILINSATEPTGKLRIGASTTIGNYLLPLLIAKFAKKYPQAKVAMQVGNTEDISESLLKGDLDLALIEGACQLKQLKQSPWRDDHLVVITAPNHSWHNKGFLKLEELLQGEWIMREAGSGTRETFENAIGSSLNQLPSVVELGHTEAIKKAVEAGLGVSCLSRLAVQRELDLGVLVAIQTPLNLARKLTLLLPDINYQSPLLKAGLEMLLAKC